MADFGKLNFSVAFNPTSAFPLDARYYFDSYAAAVEAAQGAVEVGLATGTYFIGEEIVVVENDKATLYVIQPDKTLSPVGTAPVGDDKTIEVDESGKITLKGAIDAEQGAQPRIAADGSIEWVVPSTDTVDGLQTTVSGIQSDISTIQNDLDAVEIKAGDNATAIEAIENKIGVVTEGKTVAEMIADAQTAATYDDSAIVGRVNTAESDIDALEAKSHEHSNKAELDKIADGDKAKWDAMEQNAKDYADGLNTSMGNRVKAIEDDYLKTADKTELTNAISAAEESAVDRVLGYLADEEVNASYDTLKEVAAWIESDTTASAELVTRVSNIEKDYLKGADKTAIEGEIDALGSYVGDIPEDSTSANVIAYINEVVDGLKIGDYAKASELTALAERVTVVEGKAHEHTNGTVLDGITADKVSNWDSAEKNAKDYADGLNTAMDTRVTTNANDIDALETRMSTAEGNIANKVDKVDGSRLMTNAEGTKLDGIADGAQVNIIDSVDTAQFAIDESKNLTLLDIAIGKVAGLQDALDGKANNGTTLADYGITDAYTKEETLNKIAEKITEINGGESAGEVLGQLNSYKETNDARVDTVEAKLSTIAENAQVNVIEAVNINGVALDIVDKAVNIPVATNTVLGVVMSSSAENKVSIAADGTMEINSVNVNKLVQNDDDFIVLNGGTSSI